jgi:hypothetical protein
MPLIHRHDQGWLVEICQTIPELMTAIKLARKVIYIIKAIN